MVCLITRGGVGVVVVVSSEAMLFCALQQIFMTSILPHFLTRFDWRAAFLWWCINLPTSIYLPLRNGAPDFDRPFQLRLSANKPVAFVRPHPLSRLEQLRLKLRSPRVPFGPRRTKPK